MRITLILICIFLIAPGYSQIKKVTIEYENFATSTEEDVRCGLFKATFGESIKMIEIRNENELKSLSLYYKKFTVTKLKSVDVRVLVKFYYKHFTDEYCMDRFGVFIGGQTGKSYSNEILATFIRHKCAPHFK